MSLSTCSKIPSGFISVRDFQEMGIDVPDTILPRLGQCVANCLPGLHLHRKMHPWVWLVVTQRTDSGKEVTLIFKDILARGARKTIYDAVRCSFTFNLQLVKMRRAVFATTQQNDPDSALMASRGYDVHAYLYSLMPRTLAKVPFWADLSLSSVFRYTQVAYPGTLADYAQEPFQTRCHLLSLAAAALSDFHEKGLVIHGDVVVHNFFVTKDQRGPPFFSVQLFDFDLIESLEFPSDATIAEFENLPLAQQAVNNWLNKTPVIDLIGFTMMAYVMFFPSPVDSRAFHTQLLMCDAHTTSLLYPPRQNVALQIAEHDALQTADDQTLYKILIRHRICLIWEAIFSGLHELQQDKETLDLAFRSAPKNGMQSQEIRRTFKHIQKYLPSLKEMAKLFQHLATAKTLVPCREELFKHLKIEGTL